MGRAKASGLLPFRGWLWLFRRRARFGGAPDRSCAADWPASLQAAPAAPPRGQQQGLLPLRARQPRI